MFAQIVFGLLVAVIGGTLIYFSAQMTDMFGRIERAEKNLGGTRKGYVLVGFVVIVIGFLILFGVIPLSSPMNSVATTGSVSP